MKITFYFVNFNDEFYLKFIKEHYGKFCNRIVMYDNHSTDNSVRIAKNLGFEIRFYGDTASQYNEQHLLDIKNNCWKECRRSPGNTLYADYVIVGDADEFITPFNSVAPFNPLSDSIANTKCSLPIVSGYDMISDILPVKSVFEINTGFYSEKYSKQALFCPTRIDEINFTPGCHFHNATGDITTDGSFFIHHYRMIGGQERFIERHSMYSKRMSDLCLEKGYGVEYLMDRKAKTDQWNEFKKQSTELFASML